MGGLYRLKPTVISEIRQKRYTCTTKGCPDPAVVVVPLNLHVNQPLDPNKRNWWEAEDDSTTGATRPDGEPMEMRLCRRCIRTLATALPPGSRLPGAVLRYPEIAPLTAAPQDIVGTPEYDAAHPELSSEELRAVVFHKPSSDIF